MRWKRGKRKTGKTPLNGVFGFLVIVITIGFLTSVVILLIERFNFSQTVSQVASDTDPLELSEHLSRLLEAYNKTNTTELLSLLYSVLATIAFSYGIVVFNKVQEEAKQTKKDLTKIQDTYDNIQKEAKQTKKDLTKIQDTCNRVQDTERQILSHSFFSKLEERLSLALCLLIMQQTHDSENRIISFDRFMQDLMDCERDFHISEVNRTTEITSFHYEALKSTLKMILERIPDLTPTPMSPTTQPRVQSQPNRYFQGRGSAMQKQIDVVPDGTAETNYKIAIITVREICERYLSTLNHLKVV